MMRRDTEYSVRLTEHAKEILREARIVELYWLAAEAAACGRITVPSDREAAPLN